MSLFHFWKLANKINTWNSWGRGGRRNYCLRGFGWFSGIFNKPKGWLQYYYCLFYLMNNSFPRLKSNEVKLLLITAERVDFSFLPIFKHIELDQWIIFSIIQTKERAILLIWTIIQERIKISFKLKNIFKYLGHLFNWSFMANLCSFDRDICQLWFECILNNRQKYQLMRKYHDTIISRILLLFRVTDLT